MKRADLAHVLRAASRIVDDPSVLVIGSQAILGSYSETELPDAATRSIEVDIAFFDDPDEVKSDAVDGAIGELSTFHETNGYYGQGVGVSTAILPPGWGDRLVPFDDPGAAPSEALCLEPHDLVVSKLVAGRPKDLEFALALLDAGLVDAEVLESRARQLQVIPGVRKRILAWIP